MDDSEKQTVLGILAQYNRHYLTLQRDKSIKIEVDARIDAATKRTADFRGAFKAFGFDLDAAGFKTLSEAVGKDAYNAAVAAGQELFEGKSAVDAPKQIELKAIEVPSIASQIATIERPKIRDAVLGLLGKAGEKGDGATALRKHIEADYHIELHEKTVGMTLYRLSNEGLVRRKGRTWFFVPQIAEKKNPGVDAPGQISLLNEKGGTDA